MGRAAVVAVIVALVLISALAAPTQQDCSISPCVYLPVVYGPQPTNTAIPATETATPSPTVTPTERAGLPQFKNPGFELGHVDWTEIPGNAIITQFGGVVPHMGQWLAHLGGESGSTDEMQQRITLPSAPVYLRLYYRVVSNEPVGAGALEIFADTTLVGFIDVDVSTAFGDWEVKTFDLSAYAGRVVTIRFRMFFLDSSALGDIYLDDVSLSSHPWPASKGGRHNAAGATVR